MTESLSSKEPRYLVDVTPLADRLNRFAAERAWEQFHSPKNLVMALTGEVGELNEIFQWMSEADSKSAATTPATSQAVSAELADVMLYLVRLADVLKVDLNEAVRNKLALNAQKYPVDRAHGSSKKYKDL